jgi:hypothetical protein
MNAFTETSPTILCCLPSAEVLGPLRQLVAQLIQDVDDIFLGGESPRTPTSSCSLIVQRSVPAVRIHLAPPTSPSPFAIQREIIEIGACAAVIGILGRIGSPPALR